MKACAFLLIAGLSAALRAQSGPSFEVASVKPHSPEDRGLGFPEFAPNGRFSAVGVPVRIVIAIAYDLPFQGKQLSGGPDWIMNPEIRYDFEAKAAEAELKGLSGKERTAKMRLMLQALLAERFKLVVRRETKEQPVYILAVAKNGPKLQKSKFDEKACDEPSGQCHFGGAGQGRGIHMKGSTVGELVASVNNYTDKPLVDRTGLGGLYDIETEGWVPMRPRPMGNDAESLAMADPTRPTLYMIFDKLGLKMESSKAAVEMFVIERVEKPTAN